MPCGDLQAFDFVVGPACVVRAAPSQVFLIKVFHQLVLARQHEQWREEAQVR